MSENTLRQGLFGSVMSYITLSLAAIIAITLVSIFISFWVTELADKDAQAINLSGSMRMQTYHIGLALEHRENDAALKAIDKLHQTWNDPLFAPQHAANSDAKSSENKLDRRFREAYQAWINVTRPALIAMAHGEKDRDKLQALLENQVWLTNALVNEFQKGAEKKIINLRTFQLLVLLITVLVGSLIFYLLKNRIEKPLSQLKESAEEIGAGNYNCRVNIEGQDELGLLADTFNRMSASIADSHASLEERVALRTRELQQNIIALEFLFNTARKILQSQSHKMDFQATIDDLSNILDNHNLQLCLFTEAGDRPYLQLTSSTIEHTPCGRTDCYECRNLADLEQPLVLPGEKRFPIAMGERHYGIIDLRLSDDTKIANWQENLIQSVANQFAIALSLEEQKGREQRFVMLSERTVIARELHDSLAQSLSYLKIQVTRLQKSFDKQRFDLQQPIIDELREGLASAYRQLRELLTTFRLKMDEGGLHTALESTVQQWRERSDMRIELDYQLQDLPLQPSEEIHLLQIVREAGQNAIYHSRGKQLHIRLSENADRSVSLVVTDDGVGMPQAPEKRNHYGLAIMNERSRNLDGTIEITSQDTGGTCVSFRFTPRVRHSAVH